MLRTKLAVTLASLFFFVTACQDDRDQGDPVPGVGGNSGDDGGGDGGGDGTGSGDGGDDGGSGDGGPDDGGSGDGGSGDGGADDGDDDGGTDSGAGGGPCADYRSEYPPGPYGTSPGSVMADLPGMVDGSGAPHDLFEIYQDKSKVALALINAFDT